MADKTIAQELMDAVRRADAAFAAAQAGTDPAFAYARIIGMLQGAMKMAVINGGHNPADLAGGAN
jgi:hypothetical protein